jgi:hypothetical protein
MVAVVTFNTNPTTHFDLDDLSDKTSVLNSISDLKTVMLSGERNAHTAFTHVLTNIYNIDEGQKTVVNSDLVVIMYGESASESQTLFTVFDLDSAEITLYAVGVGNFVLDSTMNKELSNIATNPDNEHTFYVEDVSYLCNYISNVTVRLGKYQ